MKGIWSIIQYIYKFIAGLGAFTLGSFVLIIMALALAATGEKPAPNVPDGAVMVLRPNGAIVEQTRLPDPFDAILSDYNSEPAETSIYDITNALSHAKNDDRIKAVALLTDNMAGAAPAHAHRIAAALRDFKDGGKKIYAISSAYSQTDYLLAAQADKIYMNPAGSVLLSGYGRFGTYFKSLLEKIGANVNVFRVGTYKSAVEPFLRNDMSPAAREANQVYVNALWDHYQTSVTSARGLAAGSLTDGAANIGANLRSSNGNFGQLALDQGLVDMLSPRASWRNDLMEDYGSTPDGSSFKQIHFQQYLAAVDEDTSHANDIAVITVQGDLIMGEGPANVAAAETVVSYIRAARNDKATKAIVLRVDSPGGSAFASELIRQELAAAQEQGIPVIASMGPVAASGGYWISATADEIWAAPTTITGSIGIFGVVPTFENTLAKIGVSTDGVGSTELSGAFDISRPLSDTTKDIIQQAIENGYDEFLSLVARGRNMTALDVDKIAQGRVWIGTTAKELGLVDHLGDFNDAVAAAARSAGLEDDAFETVFYRERPSQLDTLLMDLMKGTGFDFDRSRSSHYGLSQMSPLMKLYKQLETQAGTVLNFNDPLGRYALCLTCELRPSAQ